MTPTPPSAATSSSGHSPEEQFRVVRRRNRVPLSCHPCRTRKLKCNRGQPSCENCVKRGDSQSCVYATPTSRRKTQATGGGGGVAGSTPDDMQNRIDRLEGLVLSLMHGGANVDANAVAAAAAATAGTTTGSGSGSTSGLATGGSAGAGESNNNTPSADSSCARIEHSDGMRDDDDDDEGAESEEDGGLVTQVGMLKIDVDRGKSMYIGQEHWHSLLSDIAEVKNFYATHKRQFEDKYERIVSSKPQSARDSPIFLLSAPPATEIELRAELPSRSAIMTLISRYFNSLDTAASIIHGPTFQKQLQAHWQDPGKSSLMWVGLLYAMLCLAMLSYNKVGDEPLEWKGRTLELAAEYRLRTVQCLVAADYTKAVEYTVETLLLYLFGEYSSRWDADMGLWLIASTTTRIAMRMGYHRDSQWFPSISPFRGEMRRRAWALIRMADVMFSYQVSLPTMIYEHDTDTKLPHNLFDDEFGPLSKQLPPSRPITEPTPIAYQIAKTRLCREFGNILQAVTRVGHHVSYDQILVHDRRLREIADEMPPHLKMQPLEGCHDPVTLIIARLSLNILYNKIMCILHRGHMMYARDNPRYAHSRRSVMEASLETLQHFQNVFRECQPDGRLRTMRWYVHSTSKDTLLPTMLVMMDLHRDREAVASGKRQNSQTAFFWTLDQRRQMIRALENVRDIWKALSEDSMEGYKASNILTIMLAKLDDPQPAQGAAQDGAAASTTGSGPGTAPAATTASSGGTAGNVNTPFPGFPGSMMNDSLFGNFNDNSMQAPEQSAAMTLGMLSGTGMTPENNYQSPGGTTYPNIDFGASGGSGLTPNFPSDATMEGMSGSNNPASPFSMFTNLGGGLNNMAVDQNIDWDAFENFTQTANWGGDPTSWGFFGGNPEDQAQQQQQSQQRGGGSTSEGSGSMFGMGSTPSNPPT